MINLQKKDCGELDRMVHELQSKVKTLEAFSGIKRVALHWLEHDLNQILRIKDIEISHPEIGEELICRDLSNVDNLKDFFNRIAQNSPC